MLSNATIQTAEVIRWTDQEGRMWELSRDQEGKCRAYEITGTPENDHGFDLTAAEYQRMRRLIVG